MTQKQITHWTRHEELILIEHYSAKGIHYCARLLTNRSLRSISQRVHALRQRGEISGYAAPNRDGFDGESNTSAACDVQDTDDAVKTTALQNALIAFQRADSKFMEIAQERARRWNIFAKLRTEVARGHSHQRRVS